MVLLRFVFEFLGAALILVTLGAFLHYLYWKLVDSNN